MSQEAKNVNFKEELMVKVKNLHSLKGAEEKLLPKMEKVIC